MLKFLTSLCASMAIIVGGASSALAVTEKIITLTTNDITYDPATGLIYAAMPSTAPNHPNSLLPINPTTGALGTAIAVGQNPTRVVSSGDGTYLYVVANNSETVQRYDPATNTFATPLSILNGLNVSQIVAVPGYSDVVAISQNNPGFSPPAFQTAIYENGSALPNHVGNGIGVGGPDIIAVDYTGTEFYGYQNTVTSYTNWLGTISTGANGGITLQNDPLNGVVTGDFDLIQIAGNQLFANGTIYNTVTGAVISTFPTAGQFQLDPAADRFYSVVKNGSSRSIDVFNMNIQNSLTLLDSFAVPGETGAIENITLLPNDDLALRTDTQIILISVPEPATIAIVFALLCAGAAGLALRRKRAARYTTA